MATEVKCVCGHPAPKHQQTKIGLANPCMWVRRDGREIVERCDCPDFAEPQSPAGLARIKAAIDNAKKAQKDPKAIVKTTGVITYR
jgi:hypothetical protein